MGKIEVFTGLFFFCVDLFFFFFFFFFFAVLLTLLVALLSISWNRLPRPGHSAVLGWGHRCGCFRSPSCQFFTVRKVCDSVSSFLFIFKSAGVKL